MWAISQGNSAMEITYFETMGLNGLSLNSLILTREQAFRGREGNNLLVHAHYHVLAHFLYFFFLIPFSFLSFLFYLSLPFLLPFLFILFCSLPLLLLLLCMAEAPFILPAVMGFYYFTPLTIFVLAWVSFPDHALVCHLPSYHHLPVLAMPHPIPRKNSRILFSCSPWHSHLDKCGHSLSPSLMTFSLIGKFCHGNYLL